jgi:hypothetical protein
MPAPTPAPAPSLCPPRSAEVAAASWVRDRRGERAKRDGRTVGTRGGYDVAGDAGLSVPDLPLRRGFRFQARRSELCRDLRLHLLDVCLVPCLHTGPQRGELRRKRCEGSRVGAKGGRFASLMRELVKPVGLEDEVRTLLHPRHGLERPPALVAGGHVVRAGFPRARHDRVLEPPTLGLVALPGVQRSGGVVGARRRLRATAGAIMVVDPSGCPLLNGE